MKPKRKNVVQLSLFPAERPDVVEVWQGGTVERLRK